MVSAVSRRSKPGSSVDRTLLCEWNRNLPTCHAYNTPSVADLQGVIHEPTAEGAYRTLAMHIGPGTDFTTLSWVIGSLATQVAMHRFDRHGMILDVLLGSVAVERLSTQIPPSSMATILYQLNHSIWWCVQHLTALDPGSPDQDTSLREAVQAGDATAARRAARTLAHRHGDVWPVAVELVDEAAVGSHRAWPRALAALLVARRRAGPDALGPDDAAALGANLAAVSYLSCQPTR